MSERGWTKVGEVGVDAGLCWIGDPCYVFGDKTRWPSWSAFLRELRDLEDGAFPGPVEFPYIAGKNNSGLGVCSPTGPGDGVYPVFARMRDGRVAALKVVFDGPELDEGDE